MVLPKSTSSSLSTPPRRRRSWQAAGLAGLEWIGWADWARLVWAGLAGLAGRGRVWGEGGEYLIKY